MNFTIHLLQYPSAIFQEEIQINLNVLFYIEELTVYMIEQNNRIKELGGE